MEWFWPITDFHLWGEVTGKDGERFFCKEGLKTEKVKASLGKNNKKLSVASQSEPHIPSGICEASIGFSLCITLWGTNTACAGERIGTGHLEYSVCPG